MTTFQRESGLVIQDYIRAKWGRAGAALSADELGRALDPALRKRIDLLGVDDEKLLGVRPEEVLRRIEELEREALHEDSGVSAHRKAFTIPARPPGSHSAPGRTARRRR